MTAALPPEAAGKPVEIWFTDEARVGQQGTLTRVWAKRGSRPRARRDRRFEWAYLFGAICPERGTGAAIIMPEVNVAAMNEHLGETSRCVSAGAIALLVLDGAGWHSSPRVKGPANIVLLPLPPYAPELNPMENVWEFMRGNFLSHCVWDGYDAILEACCDAWNKLMQMTERIASLTRRTWAKPVAGRIGRLVLLKATRQRRQSLCRSCVPHRQIPAGIPGQRLRRTRCGTGMGGALRPLVQRRTSAQRYPIRDAITAPCRPGSRFAGRPARTLPAGTPVQPTTLERPDPRLDAGRGGHAQSGAR